MLQTLKSQEKPVAARWQGLSSRTRLVILLILGLGLAWLIWHFISAYLAAHNRKSPPAPPVKVAVARARNVTVNLGTIGTVVSNATVNVTAQVTGKLLTAYFQEGQIVHKGDPLFLIDTAPFRAQLQQAQAALAKDQAQAESLANDERRYTSLYAQNAASQQQRDQAVAAAKGGLANVQSDKAAVAIAEQNLGYTLIRSPIDGKTGAIAIQPGNLITANAVNPLVIITQIQPVKVSFFLAQDQLGAIQHQMATGGMMAVVTMPGGTEKAPVDFVGNIVSATTGTIELRATFPNTDQRLVPGQTVHVSASIGTLKNAVTVPRDAVNTGPDSSFVYVVDGQSKIVSQPVTVLNDDGTTDAIKGDVKAGDKVVVDGQLRVSGGMTVRVQKGRGAPQKSDQDTPSP